MNVPPEPALGELRALGLVKVADRAGSLSMHRLVHERVRHRAAAEAWSAASRRAVDDVRDSLVGLTKEGMNQIEERWAHIQEALAAAERLGMMEEWSIMADALAFYLHDRAEHDEARSLRERLLADDEKRYGPEHMAVARSLTELALVLRDLEEPARARPLLERALAICEKRYGPDHWEVAIFLSNLARVLRDLGEAARARPLLERALAIDDRTFGPAHPGATEERPHPSLIVYRKHLAWVRRALAEPPTPT
jgi:tetratricopeptide (TPR) repeat protein